MKKVVLLTLLIFGGTLVIFAEGMVFKWGNSIFKGTDYSHSYVGIYFNSGTHRNGPGLESRLLRYIDISLLSLLSTDNPGVARESAGISAGMNTIYFINDFGIPVDKFTGELHLSATYSIGGVNSLFSKYPVITGNRTHNLKFGYTGYLTTDSTSQVTGQLDYSFINGQSAFIINYENDTMLFYLTDKYRTAAFKMSYLYDFGNELIGLSIGFNLWAGERANLWRISDGGSIEISGEVNRDNAVTLYNAGEYSVDLVYLSLVYNNFSLSFGYDSEFFKEAIHNNIHYVLNDGYFPVLERPDRFYIEFKIGLLDDLF